MSSRLKSDTEVEERWSRSYDRRRGCNIQHNNRRVVKQFRPSRPLRNGLHHSVRDFFRINSRRDSSKVVHQTLVAKLLLFSVLGVGEAIGKDQQAVSRLHLEGSSRVMRIRKHSDRKVTRIQSLDFPGRTYQNFRSS